MQSTSFSVLSIGQDINIIPEEINSNHDGLNSFLYVPVHFTFRITNKDKEFEVISICARLRIGEGTTFLSECLRLTSFSIKTSEFKSGETFTFKLDDRTISFIEANRKDNFLVSIEFQISILMKSKVLFRQLGTTNSLDYIQTERATHYFSIPRSTWVENLLPGLGFRNLRLVEVPLNHSTLKEAYDNIIYEFNQAEEYFNKHDYNKCVAHCRSTLDALKNNLRKIKDNIPSESSFDWLKKVDTETFTWIDGLTKANSELASKTHHSGFKGSFARHEAESIYLVTLGLLNFISHTKKG